MVVKRLGDREYVYVKHGRTWHYIGPLDSVDLNSIIHEYTTSLPLKDSAGGGLSMSSGGAGSGKSIGKIIALIVGVLMIIIGVIIILEVGFLALSFLATSPASVLTVSLPVNNTMKALIIGAATHSKVTVTAVNAFFKVANAAVGTYTPGSLTWVNVTRVNESLFIGNYTSFTVITSNQSILIWPYKIVSGNALIIVNIATKGSAPSGTVTVNYLSLIFIVIPLALAGALIWGGVILYRWSRK